MLIFVRFAKAYKKRLPIKRSLCNQNYSLNTKEKVFIYYMTKQACEACTYQVNLLYRHYSDQHL